MNRQQTQILVFGHIFFHHSVEALKVQRAIERIRGNTMRITQNEARDRTEQMLNTTWMFICRLDCIEMERTEDSGQL